MKKVFKVTGMHCRSCVKRIEGALDDIGVRAKADFARGEVEAEWDEYASDEARVVATIAKEGYKVVGR
ncbi:copper resistance protein CopZ [Candidatus Micrarchaeota archaeon CG08_land_8_20_14_0_20_59_11]|nr:MAG: copper resistance protein CopZ [Candidatus Micrarchaeota archaeon CG08_land_8_20_14_0_20_59_11]PIT85697.1 MAG: copper resistance protein CopZ [Candidatus Micrarchaeota archaeon CG10_big_fil_rev_8_21_14_0_10_59_7]